MDEQTISFGPFRLLAKRRLLLEGNRPVRLGSRAFDILAALVERAGEVVGKDELIARAWPQTIVEESNLKIQMSALRRALGDGQVGNRYIVTVPGRGYNFVAPVRREEALGAAPAPSVPPSIPHNLPFALTRMIGRDDAVTALVARLSRGRLMTIVGAGGIGKTTVALAVAERMMAGYQDGVWLVDLAPLGDPHLVSSAIATVLGLEIRGEDPLRGVISAIGNKRMLLLLDNCEHVIDAAAAAAAALLGGAPNVGILATSREPLGTAGECKYRLAPLGIPQAPSRLTAVEAATFPAVQLFVERASAVVEDFALTDANAPAIAEVCRRLDGLPLAIEFAAPRVEALGVEGLAARLDDSLSLLGTRRRSAMPRHRTMRAVVDWSYGLLSEDEQLFFRSLGIFAGDFTVEAAAILGAAATHTDTIDRLADLVSKSLITVDISGAKPRFRLLDTTRAYALEKLDASGAREAVARDHAAYYRGLFERAESEVSTRRTDDWMADYAQEIGNVRAALDWAFSPVGERSIGMALTAAAAPLWMHLSLLEESRSRAKQALDALGTTDARDPREEMRLYAALGVSIPEGPEMESAFTRVLDVAERLGDFEYQLRALWGLYFYHAGSGQFQAALPFARKFHDLTASGSDVDDRVFGERMVGVAKHYVGDLVGARRHLERVLTNRVCAAPKRRGIRFRDVVRFQTEVHVSARAFLARVLWLQGFPDQAVRNAEMSVEEAQAINHALSSSYALSIAACPISLWVGNLDAAARYSRTLLTHAEKFGLSFYVRFGAGLEKIVALKRGGVDNASPVQDTGLDEYAQSSLGFQALICLILLAEYLAGAGRMAEGLAVVEAGLERYESSCYTPELLRIKGELVLLRGTPAAAQTAQDLFVQALDRARKQGALSWELRAATSLARLSQGQGRHADAIACLEPVFDRFTEGFGTADLISAQRLLDELGRTIRGQRWAKTA